MTSLPFFRWVETWLVNDFFFNKLPRPRVSYDLGVCINQEWLKVRKQASLKTVNRIFASFLEVLPVL